MWGDGNGSGLHRDQGLLGPGPPVHATFWVSDSYTSDVLVRVSPHDLQTATAQGTSLSAWGEQTETPK